MFFNAHIQQALRHNNLDAARFAGAVEEAMQIMGVEALPAQRVLLCAAKCYQEGGAHCDLGGGVSLYPLILARLGMASTIVDLYSVHEQGKADRLRSGGVALISDDLYTAELPEAAYDGVSIFETIEHLPHSPKPILDKMVRAMKPGGRFFLSVPNICRIENRFRMLVGRNPMGKYEGMWNSGERFLGHHREMTLAEVKWVSSQLGLRVDEVFTTDLRYKEMKGNSPKAMLARAADRHLVNDRLMPSGWRRQIWLAAHRPA